MNRKKIITTIIILLFFSTIQNNIVTSTEIKSTNLSDFSYKQKIQIPFDTSIDQTKYQPIDIKFEFLNKCYAKDENDNSIRVGVEKGGEITELESQIYDLEKTDETHISSCGLVFLIPKDADGTEEYYVFYDSIKTEIPNYEKYLFLDDSHYFYEPIPGQKIDFDYFGIKEKDDVIYAIVQKGELLGNPVALSVGKFKPGSKAVETYNLDQLCDFDLRYGTIEEPAYFGTSWATDVSKQIIVDGNLMVRVRIQCISPREDIKSDNIYTYYYCPTDTKKIYVDSYHEILKDIDIEEPSIEDGVIAGITSIKARSASIEKMNVGEILPEMYLYSKDETILDYSININPDTISREIELSTEDNIDLGSKAWACLYNPSDGKAHGLILNSNKGITDGDDDGVQVKAFVKQNIKLPGLEADTGNIVLTRNSYENGKHITKLNQGSKYNYKIEYITVEKDGYKIIDEESIIYQKLVKNIPIFRENVTIDEEEIIKYSLKTYVHLAPSIPLGSLLSATLGKNISYIYAELYKENNFKSSGVVSRLSLGSIEIDLEGKNLLQKIRTIFRIFDWKNFSFFKKVVFPNLEIGTYVVKIFKENPIFGKQRKYIGFGIVDLKKNEILQIYCRPEGKIKLLIQDQNKLGIENIKINLLSDNIIVSDSITDNEGVAIIYAPCLTLKKYTLKIIYDGFLIEEKEIKLNLKNHFIEFTKSFSFELYDVFLSLKDTWDFIPEVEVNPKITSNEMIESMFLFGKKNDKGQYEFLNLLPGKYQLSMSYKSFIYEKEININNDLKLNLEFPAEYPLSLNVYNSYGGILSEGQICISRFNKIKEFEINQKGYASIDVPPGEYKISVVLNDKEIAKQNLELKGEKNINIISSEDSLLHNMMLYLCFILIILAFIIYIWKRNLDKTLKIIAITLIFFSLFSPWWILNGEEALVKTTTKTFLIPQKIITLSSSTNVLGGEISQVPDEVTDVLGILMILLIISCLLIFFSIFTKRKYRKITIILSILSIILIILTISIFYYTLSQLTEIGIGSFIGGGEIEITIPGSAETKLLNCNWGPGIGFFLSLAIIIIFAIYLFIIKYQKYKG
jgi:hypothetical protein